MLRDFDGRPHRFTKYDLDGMVLKVYEWTEKYHGSGHSGLFIETEDLDGAVGRIRGYGRFFRLPGRYQKTVALLHLSEAPDQYFCR